MADVNTLIIPSPQKRYLEPYRNRTFQYDTKNSNLFLSHYVNQILNVCGDNVIVRGLKVNPSINKDKTGIDFTIEPGALIQDVTYFEFAKETKISVPDVTLFPNLYLLISTNWQYIQTVYDNDLRIELTFYNPRTQKTVSPWNVITNRIILGLFSYQLTDGIITNIKEITGDILFKDTNVIYNSDFDQLKTTNWVPYNSTVRVIKNGGVEDSPYLNVNPITNADHGVYQTISTKAKSEYELSFYVKSDNLIPFKTVIYDGTVNYTASGEYQEIDSHVITVNEEWVQYKYRFTALSVKTTILFLKLVSDRNTLVNLDDIYCIEYQKIRPATDINKIHFIDGGNVNVATNIPVEEPEEQDPFPLEDYASFVWKGTSTDGSTTVYQLPESNEYYSSDATFLFLGGALLDRGDYSLDAVCRTLTFNFVPEAGLPIKLVQFTTVDLDFLEEAVKAKKWSVSTAVGTNEYRFNFPNPFFYEGCYLSFYSGVFVSPDDLVVSKLNNDITLRFKPTESRPLDLLYLDKSISPNFGKVIKTKPGVRTYPLDFEVDPILSLVFLDGLLLNRNDYDFAEEDFILNFDPKYNADVHIVDLNELEEFIPSIWRFALSIGTHTYQKPNFFTAEESNYLVYYCGLLLDPSEYNINLPDQTITFNFTPEDASQLITIVCLNTNKKLVSTNSKIYQLPFEAGKTEYYVPSSFNIPATEGVNLVFSGGMLLHYGDYNFDFENRKIILSSPLSTGNLIIINVRTPEDDSAYIFRFNSLKTKLTYQIDDSKLQANTNYIKLVFYAGALLKESDYSISKTNLLTLKFTPEENDIPIIVYYLEELNAS